MDVRKARDLRFLEVYGTDHFRPLLYSIGTDLESLVKPVLNYVRHSSSGSAGTMEIRNRPTYITYCAISCTFGRHAEGI
jgi:hypothetical protein